MGKRSTPARSHCLRRWRRCNGSGSEGDPLPGYGCRTGCQRASTSGLGMRAIQSSWRRSMSADGADELVFLDITASSGGWPGNDARRGAAHGYAVFIPLTVGGGVRARVDDFDALLRAGADKVG